MLRRPAQRTHRRSIPGGPPLRQHVQPADKAAGQSQEQEPLPAGLPRHESIGAPARCQTLLTQTLCDKSSGAAALGESLVSAVGYPRGGHFAIRILLLGFAFMRGCSHVHAACSRIIDLVGIKNKVFS